jgi:hypothetical protein
MASNHSGASSTSSSDDEFHDAQDALVKKRRMPSQTSVEYVNAIDIQLQFEIKEVIRGEGGEKEKGRGWKLRRIGGGGGEGDELRIAQEKEVHIESDVGGVCQHNYIQ